MAEGTSATCSAWPGRFPVTDCAMPTRRPRRVSSRPSHGRRRRREGAEQGLDELAGWYRALAARMSADFGYRVSHVRSPCGWETTMWKREESSAPSASQQNPPPPAAYSRDAADKLVMNLGKSVMI